jgi:hypothetical protein
MRALFYGLRYCPLILPRAACRMGGETYDPVREPRADPQAADPQAADPQAADPQAADPQAADPQAADPQAADPPGVRACPDPPARRSVVIPSRRTVLGCNRQTSLFPRFIKTRRTSSRPCAVIRAPWQRVSAHGARQACACYRLPRRIRWISARVSFSIFSGWSVVRRARVYVIRLTYTGSGAPRSIQSMISVT